MEDDDKTTRNCKRSSTTESSSSSTSPLFSKKIKLDSPFQKFDLGSVVSDDFGIHNHRHHSLFSVSPATSSNSGGFSTTAGSRSSSSDSTEVLKDSLNSVDPEVKSCVETESSLTSAISNNFSRDTPPTPTTPSSAMENSKATTVKSSRKLRLPAEKIPCQVEIDEFFAEAEKKEQKRFASKYNYDIAKDSPLEGRYQWVRLKP